MNIKSSMKSSMIVFKDWKKKVILLLYYIKKIIEYYLLSIDIKRNWIEKISLPQIIIGTFLFYRKGRSDSFVHDEIIGFGRISWIAINSPRNEVTSCQLPNVRFA